MEDELDLSLEGKNLGNLRVVDLKQQLEKRGLSKSGSKKDLVKRLKSQLEFEKLGEERKLGAGGDLKLELDAATEQNEFVKQYLARQQKLLAEQNTSVHTSESEEIQNSDEDEKCDSGDGYKSNEIISEERVNRLGDSERTDISKEQKIVNIKESADNIECEAEEKESRVEKLDTNAVVMPAPKDCSTMNICNQSQTPKEQVEGSTIPYSLSDIQLPESPKEESARTVSEKEGSKSVGVKMSSKSSSEEESKKSIAENKTVKSVSEVEPATPVVEKESTKSVAENESIKCDDVQNVEKEHEKSIKPDQVKTNGLKISDSSTASKSTSLLSKSQDKAPSLKSDDLNQNTKSSSNDQNCDEKQMKNTSRSRSGSADDKDSTKVLKPRSSPKRSSRKPSPSKNVSKEIVKDREDKTTFEDSRNRSSSDSGEYKSDEEVKVTKASTPTKRRYSRSENSESSSSSERESNTKQSSKSSAKKLKVDSLKKTEDNKTSCPVESGAKTVLGGESFKGVGNSSSRKRLKIKRDNVVLEEQTSSKQESSTEKNILQAEIRSDSSTDKKASCDIPNSLPKDPETEEEIPKPYVSRKVTLSNRKLSRSSVDEKEESAQKKSKWGSFATAHKNSRNISISTSSLKSWFPDFKLNNEPAPTTEIMPMEQSPPLIDEKGINHTSERENGTLQRPPLTQDLSEQDTQSAMEEEPIEQGPVSNIIFIQNLVRPFTLLQLKELLKQHGNFIEGEFWIDKIKSKCIVVYENEEAAAKAKNALNNTRWPPSNPKILTVQYISEEEIDFHKRGGEPPKPIVEPPVETVECYDVKPMSPVEESKRRDRENRRDREKSKPLREWDKDKIVQDSPERERYMNKENEKIKPVEKKEKKESKRRPTDDTPAKLLDDLFQKTKASPCIYWLPLTVEQIKERAEQKRMRRLEQEKRHLKEQEGGDHKKIVRSGHRSRERELPRSSSRSRSPISRRR